MLKALLCILNCYTFRALIQDSLYNFVKVFRNFRCLEIKLFICYCVCIVKDGKFDIDIYFSFVFDLCYTLDWCFFKNVILISQCWICAVQGLQKHADQPFQA